MAETNPFFIWLAKQGKQYTREWFYKQTREVQEGFLRLHNEVLRAQKAPTTPVGMPPSGKTPEGLFPEEPIPPGMLPYEPNPSQLGGSPGSFSAPGAINAPGTGDWWYDQPYGAQWLNRLMGGGQIGAGGGAVNPYQSWLVGQADRARNLTWMENLMRQSRGQDIGQFGTMDIPWGGGRGLFSSLAGLDPQSAVGTAFGQLTPAQATSMALTASRGNIPQIMRQQMNTDALYNRYLATAGAGVGAEGFAPWLSSYYGF